MKCLITGGAGFIGSHLVDKLIEQGHQVVVIDDLSRGLKENINSKATFLKLDIRDKKLKEVFDKEIPEVVFHLAAQKNVRISVEKPLIDADVNILGSLNLFENCLRHKVKVIFASTGGAIYGDTDKRPTLETHSERPVSPYGVAKLTVEKYLYYYQKVFHLDYVSLRLSNVYGPRQDPEGEAGVVAIFLDKILSGGQPIINGDGKQTRDYIYVSDVVNSCLAVIKKEIVGIYNIGTSLETEVNHLFKKIVEIGNFSVKEKHGSPIPGEQMTSSLDFTKAKEDFGWAPKIKLDKGLKLTIEWFKKRYEKKN